MKPKIVFAILIGAACLSGCAQPVYDRLLSEYEIPGLREGKMATDAVGKRTFRVPVTWRDHEINLAIHEMGTGNRSRLLVLLHGGFSDHETWRFVAGYLAESNDLLLIDFPGCGASDQPDPDQVPDDFFSPAAVAEMTLQAVESRIRERSRPPESIALIGHSLGCTTTLQMYHDEVRPRHPTVLNRVNRLVLFAPMDLAVPKPDATFQKLIDAKLWQMRLADSIGVLSEMGAEAMEQSMNDPRNAPREDVPRGVAVLVDREQLGAAGALLDQAFMWNEEGFPDWEQIDYRLSAYRNVHAPTLVVCGEHDESLPSSMGYKVAAELPAARLEMVKNAKHSVHVEFPVKAVRLIEKHLESGKTEPGEVATP